MGVIFVSAEREALTHDYFIQKLFEDGCLNHLLHTGNKAVQIIYII